MNIHVRPTEIEPHPATTLAAEGLPRRKWTVDEVERLAGLGVFGGDDRPRERFELIGGEIVPMSAKGATHENVKRRLLRHWYRALPPALDMLPETTLRIGPHDFREPDIIVFPAAVATRDIAPDHIRLIVEVSDSSLDYDLGPKARFYASLGLPDFWVIDARRLITRLHRNPGGETWGNVTDHPGSALLTPALAPDLAVRLADIGLEPVIG